MTKLHKETKCDMPTNHKNMIYNENTLRVFEDPNFTNIIIDNYFDPMSHDQINDFVDDLSFTDQISYLDHALEPGGATPAVPLRRSTRLRKPT